MKKQLFITVFFILFFIAVTTQAKEPDELNRLQQAYPEHIKKIYSNYIVWDDGARMQISGSFALTDFIFSLFCGTDRSIGSISREGVEHDSYEPFFRKMYGNSPAEVKKKLTIIYWMPHVFGTRYPLKVTTVNGVDKKLQRISAELEKLPHSYYKFVENPGGSFYWRNVARENYLSAHSFGIAIDINLHYSNYWIWDLEKSKQPVRSLTYRNRIPLEIVKIFEKEGFFWGGRWYFYDTMHFEYRPELFIS